jgi:hypothetical protein
MSKKVDSALEQLDVAMKQLRRSVRGIPYREGGFNTKHRKLALDMAMLTVLVDSARPRFPYK